jgi:hypothetical protein
MSPDGAGVLKPGPVELGYCFQNPVGRAVMITRSLVSAGRISVP